MWSGSVENATEYDHYIDHFTDHSLCTYYQWLPLNRSVQHPRLVYTKGTFGVYEMTLSTNNSFETGDILGVRYRGTPSTMSTQRAVLYQRGGAYCDTLGDITIHLSGNVNISYPHQDPVLPYIAIMETGQQILNILFVWLLG